MADLVIEILFGIFIQIAGRSVLWGLYAGRRAWSEFDDFAVDAAGIFFWVVLFSGIVIAGIVFG
jgi:hypothetical protein